VLIKKKDVNEYFATRSANAFASCRSDASTNIQTLRRSEEPIAWRWRAKRASAVPATDPSKEKSDGKVLSAAPIDAAGSSASTQDLGVPLFTSEHGFIGAPPSVTKRKEKS
jgi:hypothetical protein